MSIFDGKDNLTRAEIREILRKDSGKVPDSSRRLTREERMALERELLREDEYGPLISEGDFRVAIGKVQKSKSEAPTKAEWWRRERTARFMEKLVEPKEES